MKIQGENEIQDHINNNNAMTSKAKQINDIIKHVQLYMIPPMGRYTILYYLCAMLTRSGLFFWPISGRVSQTFLPLQSSCSVAEKPSHSFWVALAKKKNPLH